MEIQFEVRFTVQEKKIETNLDEYSLLHGASMLCSLFAYFAEQVVAEIFNLTDAQGLQPNDSPIYGICETITCSFSTDTSQDFVKSNLAEVEYTNPQQKINFLTDFLAFIYSCCQALEVEANKSIK